jgi:galactose-1-phosphate uridylyltransferase
MSNPQQLEFKLVESIVQASSIENLDMKEIANLFLNETSISNFRPESIFQIDPRNGELIVYNSSRATRPSSGAEDKVEIEKAVENCPICMGKTTGIMDITHLSEGFSFINKNMFPIFFPYENDPQNGMGTVSFGLHFLQWTSSFHNRDWHNIPLKDANIVLSRLATLEKKLLLESFDNMPGSLSSSQEKPTYGYVSIIKNYGKAAGGSLAHGHQQIVSSNIMPKQFFNNWSFYERRGIHFTKYLLQENPEELTVKDYGKAILVVPYFMRRPFDMFLILKDTSKKFLHELDEEELETVAKAWQEATRVILLILKNLKKKRHTILR